MFIFRRKKIEVPKIYQLKVKSRDWDDDEFKGINYSDIDVYGIIDGTENISKLNGRNLKWEDSGMTVKIKDLMVQIVNWK